ncbi:MAG: MFS transporter, partial [Bacteroidota bacterium]|nr:MFS transporter [Bacteroidota bacterium]
WIRVFGTIGWIVAGFIISLLGWDSQSGIQEGLLRNTFTMTAIASAFLGVFSFLLPKTPPIKSDENQSILEKTGLSSVTMLKNKNFLIFFISSILICIPLAFYYQNTNPFLTELQMENPTLKQSIGQISEVLFMLLIPVFLLRFGIKKTLLFGMLAWVIRYVLFAFGNADELSFMLLIGIALHGVCYDFFFVSGQIYTDSKAGSSNKSAAQGLITLATYGVGMLIGFWVAGQITDNYLVGETHDWKTIWLYPAAFAAAVFVFFLIAFKNEKIEYKREKV